MKNQSIQLIKGVYSREEAIDLVRALTDVKIKYLEGKIKSSDNEEDIEMRETRIKELQRQFNEYRMSTLELGERIEMSGEIHF